VLGTNVWRRVLGVDSATVIEWMEPDEETESPVIHARARRPKKRRCGLCGFRPPRLRPGNGASQLAS
jgi:hypothetical protein